MRANSLILTLFTADFVWGIEFNLSFLDSELICHERAEIRVTGSKMAHQKEKSSTVFGFIVKIKGFCVL
jgi:hypothetical protein